ncbi:MAG: SPFH domain-containing protein [Planctomycetota bacterium]|jgi:regulator of protease activity HflC (stomatin/prohibitin superfamily)
MAEEDKKTDTDLQPQTPDKSKPVELDAAGKSLSEALSISFVILKVIMGVLIFAFLASGFKTVDSDKQALVLRFGKIRGVGEGRVLKPRTRPYWIIPYPVERMVQIPVEKKVDLAIRSFWYSQTKEEMLMEPSIQKTRFLPELDPIKDGYCITRSEKPDETISGSSGSDYNIVHCKWRLTYQIDDPIRFFKNIYVEDIKPGDIYLDVVIESITPLLQNIFEDAIVTATVNYTIDDIMYEQVTQLTADIKRLMQEKLNTIESGLKVVQVQLTEKTWPRQVDAEFQKLATASQDRQTSINAARAYAESTLNKAAGPVAEKLFAALKDDTVSEEEKELLWSQLAGTAQETISQARSYQTRGVANARANAEYLKELLPEYRKHPNLVIDKIYRDAIERIFNNVDEKFVIPKGANWRILLNRDPSLKPKNNKEQTTP